MKRLLLLAPDRCDAADGHNCQRPLRPEARAPGNLEPKRQAVISQPLSMLVLWLVFAVAAGIKFWGLAAQLRKCPEGTSKSTEEFRKTLERIWAMNQQRAQWST